MGCLTAPFKLAGCFGLVLLLGLGWLYRDRVWREAQEWLPGGSASRGASLARPGTRALAAARAKVDSLAGRRVDSVVLAPAEVASLIGAGMDGSLRSLLDSMQVGLGEGEIEVHARLRTERLRGQVPRPLSFALRERESIEAAGPVRVAGVGQGEWLVRAVRLRGLPVPRDAVPGVMGRALGDSLSRTVPVSLPRGVHDIRLRPSGATLYGASRP